MSKVALNLSDPEVDARITEDAPEDEEALSPDHYKSQSVRSQTSPRRRRRGPLEVIDVAEEFELELHEFNVIKYVLRAKMKGNRIENLKKARQYLSRKINLLEGRASWKHFE